jgi:hypothetical protein
MNKDELDKEKYAELVAEAYKKVMDIAEEVPDIKFYYDEEMEDL